MTGRLIVCLAVCSGGLAQVPAEDRRNTEIRHTDAHYSMAGYTKVEWERRAEFLRKQILFSSGLLPLPRKEPLNASVGERIEHEDFTIDSVLLETYPGYFLGGNLYRPAGGNGPYPAILSPHGHWRYGRFENSEINSVPGRAISLARQGYVVFAYDMVGWNDTMQVPHGFAGPREELWLVGTLGLQLWNSIRVVDYLASLPEVDGDRIAVTGASGGGTQAFLLAAVDDRIGFSAPVNMVSFRMQGGSRCENAPLLRIDTNNVEFSAAFAPKPQLLVAATGDWTVGVPDDEFPAVRGVYRLLDAESNVEWRQFDSPHNYHKDSREAVYAFFGKRILGDGDASRFTERSFRTDQLSLLLYLWGRPLPDRAVGFEEFVRQRVAAAEADTLALAVSDALSLGEAQAAFSQRLGLSILAEVPRPGTASGRAPREGELVLGRQGAGDRIPAILARADSRAGKPTLVVHPDGKEAAAKTELGRAVVNRDAPVLMIDAFQTGAAIAERDIAGVGRMGQRYFHVFNRSDDANRVQDILTAAAFLREHAGTEDIRVIGFGRAGLWVLLAAALDRRFGAVVADLDGFDAANDAEYVRGLFIPGLRRAGDFRAVAVLAPGGRLLLHNAHQAFPTGWFQAAFDAAGRPGDLSIETGTAETEALVAWLYR